MADEWTIVGRRGAGKSVPTNSKARRRVAKKTGSPSISDAMHNTKPVQSDAECIESVVLQVQQIQALVQQTFFFHKLLDCKCFSADASDAVAGGEVRESPEATIWQEGTASSVPALSAAALLPKSTSSSVEECGSTEGSLAEANLATGALTNEDLTLLSFSTRAFSEIVCYGLGSFSSSANARYAT